MKQVKLSNSDLNVSPLMVGGWCFGGGENSYWGTQDQKDVDELVNAALDIGVNFFDTGLAYNEGRSESALGHALAGKRDKAVICDKLYAQSKEELIRFEETFTGCLKRLNTDYIDIMMLHWPVFDVELLKANLEAMKKMQEKGAVRYIGVSNFGVKTLEIAKSLGIEVVLNQAAYNLMTRALEYEILPYCVENNIGVAAYMPLMQGILTGKYATIGDIPLMRRRTIHFDNAKNPHARHGGKGTEAEVTELLRVLRKMAKENGMEPGQIAIAWTAAREGVQAVVTGCRNRQQLVENAKAVETQLTEEMIAVLDKASNPIKDILGDNADLFQSKEETRVW